MRSCGDWRQVLRGGDRQRPLEVRRNVGIDVRRLLLTDVYQESRSHLGTQRPRPGYRQSSLPGTS